MLRSRWYEAHHFLDHRWRRFREEPVNQVKALARILGAELGKPRPENDQTHLRLRAPLCTFQAVSHETELALKHLFAGEWRSRGKSVLASK